VVPVDKLSSSEVETSSLNEMLHERTWLDNRPWCLGNLDLEYERYVAHALCSMEKGCRDLQRSGPFLGPLQPH
jgi:hypothetical protein